MISKETASYLEKASSKDVIEAFELISLGYESRIKKLEDAIRECLADNAHLADGCTLIKLKRVINE